MIEEEVARRRILQALPGATGECLPLSDCLGRRAIEDVIAAVALPGFDNSAMDGYAVRFSALTADAETKLKVIGTAFAGKLETVDQFRNGVAHAVTGHRARFLLLGSLVGQVP